MFFNVCVHTSTHRTLLLVLFSIQTHRAQQKLSEHSEVCKPQGLVCNNPLEDCHFSVQYWEMLQIVLEPQRQCGMAGQGWGEEITFFTHSNAVVTTEQM